MTDECNESNIVWHELTTPAELSIALAHALHTQTLSLLGNQAQLLIGLAGGSTPMTAYAEFSQAPVPWSKIILTLIDERFVPISDQQSNERNIANAFIEVKSQLAGWHGLYHQHVDIEQSAKLANQERRALNQAMDIVVIGMGTDGHIASLFVESADYVAAMNINSTQAVLPIRFAQQAQKIDRLSFTLAELLKAKKMLICISGAEKRSVLEDSLNGNKPEYAVAQLLKYYPNPVEIFWSPA